jgi:hypothetical protein
MRCHQNIEYTKVELFIQNVNDKLLFKFRCDLTKILIFNRIFDLINVNKVMDVL